MTGRPEQDLRLVPAAVAAYAAAAAVVALTGRSALVAGCAAAALALGVGPAVAALTRVGRSGRATDQAPGHRSETEGRRGLVGQVVLVAAVVAAVLLAGGAQLTAREAGGLASLAADRATVTLEGTVQGAPTDGPSWPGAAAQVRLTLAVETVTARGVRAGSGGSVTVRADESWAAAVPGSRVVVRGRLSGVDRAERPVALLAATSALAVVDPPPAWQVWAAGVRAGLVKVAATVPGDAGALLPGIAVGDVGQVPEDLTAAMRVSGLTHLTAVSGAHFALVGAVALAAAGAVRVPRRLHAGVVVLALGGFLLLVPPGPSVQRAAAMGAVGVGGLLLGRPARAVPALGAGVVLLLVADPWLSREIGFALSVVATAGLILLAGPLAQRWSGRVGAPLAYALAVPVVAQCVCAPLIVLLSPTVSTYAVAANLLAAPAVAPATVLGLATALLAPWWPAAAAVLAPLAGAACWWIAAVARTAARLPGAQLAWPAGTPGALLLGVAGIAALVLALGAHRRDEGRERRRFVAP